MNNFEEKKLFKPSELGEIPHHWKRVKFGEITKVRQGLQIAISERLTKQTSTSEEYITIQSINKANQDREYVESPSDRVICKKHDVLMTRTGNTGIVVTGVEGAFHNNFFLIDYKRNEIITEFLVNYLRSKRVQHVLLTKAGTSTIPDLNHKDFYSIEFPLAPLPEQQKIAQILSTWDKAIEKLEALIAAKQQRKKALMQQLLTGEKRFSGFDDEWRKLKLKQVFDNTGGTALERFVSEDGDYHFISIGNYSKEGKYIDKFQRIPLNETTSTKLLEEDDFVMVLNDKTSTGEIIGSTLWIKEKNKFIYNQRSEKLTPRKNIIFPAYAWFLLNSELIRKTIFSLSQGGTQIYVNFSALKEIILFLPELKEQQKIAAVLSAADREIETQQKHLAALKQQKQGLMQQLLTGKKRVKTEV